MGPIAWIRANLFSSWSNSLLTIVSIIVVYKLVVAVVDWAFLSAGLDGLGRLRLSRRGAGACWAFVRASSRNSSMGAIRSRSGGASTSSISSP